MDKLKKQGSRIAEKKGEKAEKASTSRHEHEFVKLARNRPHQARTRQGCQTTGGGGRLELCQAQGSGSGEVSRPGPLQRQGELTSSGTHNFMVFYPQPSIVITMHAYSTVQPSAVTATPSG